MSWARFFSCPEVESLLEKQPVNSAKMVVFGTYHPEGILEMVRQGGQPTRYNLGYHSIYNW